MCDLIDLNSPDPRKFLKTKLASPLIPGPETPPTNNDENKQPNSIDFVSKSKRTSLDNNPFDKVYKETADYVAKKDDPFEVVLEKAQENAKKNKYENKEDFTPRRRRHSDVLKLNKTLEEPLLQGILNKNFNQMIKLTQLQDSENSFIKDLNKTDLLDDNREENKTQALNGLTSPNIIVHPPSPADCSVLNQSAMNDSLTESSGSFGNSDMKDKNEDQVAAIIETAQNCSISITDNGNDLLRPFKHRRSFSQGTKNSPEKGTHCRPRSKSIIENLIIKDIPNKSRFSSVSSAASSNTDYANKAFLESGSTATSESLDISRISATPKLSQSSLGSMNSLYSCNSKNKAFILDSQCSSQILGSTSTAKSSLNISNISKSTSNFLANTPLNTPVKINDLQFRFEKLKLKSIGNVGELPLYSPNRKVEHFLRGDREENFDGKSSNRQETEARLIDADVFIPLRNSAEDDFDTAQGDSVSNSSSDSVFIDNEKVDHSVLKEARLLARTFNELAHQSTTNSFSSGEDFLYSRPRWNFDVLPVSDDEDEAVVDNLIELPVSPSRNKAEVCLSGNEEVQENERHKSTKSKVSEEIRELETEFIDQDVSKNKVMAATLLLDLEKIIHRENNPEAISLLENLEKVLGVKYESNSQLLATCMQWTNNLNKSPRKSIGKLGSKENIRQDSLEKSHEDNNDAGLLDSVTNQEIINDENLVTNLNNKDKEINKSEKSFTAAIDSPVAVDNRETLDSQKCDSDSKPIENDKKGVSVDQVEALELITNLSRILGGSRNDSSPLSLLSNLRQVLNLAANQLNFESSQVIKSKNQDTSMEIRQEKNTLQKKSLAKSKADPNKSGRKRSSDSSSKDLNTGSVLTKRSMSFGSGQRNMVQAVALTREKIKSHSRSFKKALSCDADPEPDTQVKTSAKPPETCRGRASSICGTGKYKLKKKTESENVTGRKGPLKALIPVGNMQRRGSVTTKVAPISLSRTPPKSRMTVPPSAFASATSSTPNTSAALIVTKKSPQTKPVASSTPDGGSSKNRRMKIQFSKTTAKPKFSCNISPVTPLPTQTITSNVISKGSPKNHRHNKTLSPPKRRGSQESQNLNTTLSSIPKFSPLAGFTRRNSKESNKTLETSGSPKSSINKSQTPKKSQTPFVHSKSESQIPQSPLKTMNNQNSKFKPFNLISKLRRGSNGSNVSDKENCA